MTHDERPRWQEEWKSPRTKEEWEALHEQDFRKDLEDFYAAYLKRAETGERAAYIKAILALMRGLDRLGVLRALDHSRPQDRETAAFTWHGALVWLVQLASELKDLDAGIVSPTLTPAGGSKALPTPEWMDRMTLVCLIEQLHAMGMKYEAAARRAIVDAKVHGMKVLGTAEDALSWRAEFQKGRVKNERAVWFYNQIMEYLRKTRARDGGIEEIERRYKQTLRWVGIALGQIPKT